MEDLERIVLRNQQETLRLAEWILTIIRQLLETSYDLFKRHMTGLVLTLLDGFLSAEVSRLLIEQNRRPILSHLAAIVKCVTLNEKFSTNLSRSLRIKFKLVSDESLCALNHSNHITHRADHSHRPDRRCILWIRNGRISRTWRYGKDHLEFCNVFHNNHRPNYAKNHGAFMQLMYEHLWRGSYDIHFVDCSLPTLQKPCNIDEKLTSTGPIERNEQDMIAIKICCCDGLSGEPQGIALSQSFVPSREYLIKTWSTYTELLFHSEEPNIVTFLREFCRKLGLNHPDSKRTLLITVNDKRKPSVQLCFLLDHLEEIRILSLTTLDITFSLLSRNNSINAMFSESIGLVSGPPRGFFG